MQVQSEQQHWHYVTLWQNARHQSGRACRDVTGCHKPTNVEDLYLPAGISPPDTRRDVWARMEKTKQKTNEDHFLYWQHPAEIMMKSRNCSCVVSNLLKYLLRSYVVMNGVGDYKQHQSYCQPMRKPIKRI